MKIDRTNEELYYLENGRIVFTEKYHVQRAYCCGSGCRHCPYEPFAQKGNTKLKSEWERISQLNTKK